MAERATRYAATPPGSDDEEGTSTLHVSAQVKKRPSGGTTHRRGVVRREVPPRFDNPFNERRGKCPWRTSLMAAFLFSVGVIFLSAGLWKWFNSNDRSGAIAMITLGSLTFLPGSYASYILVGACRGWKGYHYDDVPSYDEY